MSAKRKQGGGKRQIPLKKVQAGDAFLAPLADGRLCVCRVLQVAPDGGSVLVCGSPWIGAEPPDPAEPQLRQLFRPASLDGKPYLHWVWDPVPVTFKRLGVIPPTAEEAALDCQAFSGWESFAIVLFRQWRWDHDLARLLADEAVEERAQREVRKREEQARQEWQERERRAYKPLPETLEELRREAPFAGWAGYVKPAALRSSRRLIRELIDALTALGPDSSEPARLDGIYQCVERFNLLDGTDFDICTIEREDICALLDRIGATVGLDDYGEDLDGNREW